MSLYSVQRRCPVL